MSTRTCLSGRGRSSRPILSSRVIPSPALRSDIDLDAKTVFAANYDTLQDDPHMLRAGQELRILPVDGVYWEWLGGIPFSQWAAYFGVSPEAILNYPANKLDPTAIADPSAPDIKVGTFLIIPGGAYQYHTPGQVPLGITRANPASAQVGGAGACPPTPAAQSATAHLSTRPTDISFPDLTIRSRTIISALTYRQSWATTSMPRTAV